VNVLSLFDGISCARIAIENAGHSIDNYFSSEVDKSCVQLSSQRFPDSIQLGDVRNIKRRSLPKINFLIGGSPCQDLSNAFKGTGLEGARSSLFYEFIRLLNELKPDFFLLENVKSSHQKLMDDAIGVKGIEINSAHFSAQSRPRCYWTNLRIDQLRSPCTLVIKDILESKVPDKYFIDPKISLSTIPNLAVNSRSRSFGIKRLGEIDRSDLKDNERQRRVYSTMGKSPTLLARADSPKILVGKRIRKLTPLECERLQCVPDNYTEGFSATSRYKMVGNGFTVGVISHIIGQLQTRTLMGTSKQLELF